MHESSLFTSKPLGITTEVKLGGEKLTGQENRKKFASL